MATKKGKTQFSGLKFEGEHRLRIYRGVRLKKGRKPTTKKRAFVRSKVTNRTPRMKAA